jgi:DHA1 family tetracycline resistance protein-like MFS transporter
MAQFFGAPILGSLSDKFGRKKMLMISVLGSAISYALMAWGLFIHHIILMFIARVLDGFTGGNVSIVGSAVADVSGKNKTHNFSILAIAFAMGFILGPFLGGYLSDHTKVAWFSFSTPLVLAAMLALLNFTLISTYFTETLEKKNRKKHVEISIFSGVKSMFRVFRKRNKRMLMSIIFLYFAGFAFFTEFFQVVMVQKFNVTQSTIGEFYAIMGLWLVFMQAVIVGRLTKRVRYEKLPLFSLIVISIVIFVGIIQANLTPLYFLLPVFALAVAITQPSINAVISDNAEEHEQGEMLGVTQSMGSLALAIVPMLAGFLAAINIVLPTIIASIMLAISWGYYVYFYKVHYTKRMELNSLSEE